MSTFSEQIDSYHKVTPEKIAGFFKDYRFLSNFHGCAVKYNGQLYTSSEAAFQAAKSLDPEDHKRFATMTAAESKKEGRKLNLRADWDDVKDEVMMKILLDKFKDPELTKQLLDTGDAILEETNHWGDVYWGVDAESGEGRNTLGKILMVVRGVLKSHV